MFMNDFKNKTENFIHFLQLFIFFALGCILFKISQVNEFYMSCNKERQKCVIGEIKEGVNVVDREIKYSEIKGYYLYNSPKGYFSTYDNRPNTTFVLKIKQKNRDENVMLPFVGRIDLSQADKLYNDILNQGVHIEQKNHYNLFFCILSILSFVLFFVKIYSLFARKKDVNDFE